MPAQAGIQPGYDVRLYPSDIAKLPEGLKGAKTVLDLFETIEGRDWWVLNGTERTMIFDLAGGSRSLNVLAEFLDKSGVKL